MAPVSTVLEPSAQQARVSVPSAPMAVGQDQLVFHMAVGERQFVRTVYQGAGEETLRQVFEADSRWIQVDGSIWILRDHVLFVELVLAE